MSVRPYILDARPKCSTGGERPAFVPPLRFESRISAKAPIRGSRAAPGCPEAQGGRHYPSRQAKSFLASRLQGRLDDLDILDPLRLAGDLSFVQRVGIFLQPVELSVRIEVENVAELGGELLARRGARAAVAARTDHVVACVDQLLQVDLEPAKIPQGWREHAVAN